MGPSGRSSVFTSVNNQQEWGYSTSPMVLLSVIVLVTTRHKRILIEILLVYEDVFPIPEQPTLSSAKEKRNAVEQDTTFNFRGPHS